MSEDMSTAELNKSFDEIIIEMEKMREYLEKTSKEMETTDPNISKVYLNLAMLQVEISNSHNHLRGLFEFSINTSRSHNQLVDLVNNLAKQISNDEEREKILAELDKFKKHIPNLVWLQKFFKHETTSKR